jgi:hypothetical protein
LELQQRQELRASSKPEYLTLASLPACDGARHVLPRAFQPFLAEEFEEAHLCIELSAQTPRDQTGPQKGDHKAPVTLKSLDLEAYLALMNAGPDLGLLELHPDSQPDISVDLAANCENQSDPTPIDFI